MAAQEDRETYTDGSEARVEAATADLDAAKKAHAEQGAKVDRASAEKLAPEQVKAADQLAKEGNALAAAMICDDSNA